MTTSTKRRDPTTDHGAQNIINHGNFILPDQGIVNLESPRLWRAFRKFNRNFKRIARLQNENARLLDEMRRAQGGGEVRHVA